MKNTIYAALAATFLTLGACGGSEGEVAKPTPAAAPAAADGVAADTEKKAADEAPATPVSSETPATPVSSETPATPATSESRQLGAITDAQMAEGYALLMAMAKAVADNKGDCTKIGAALHVVFDGNAEVMKTMSGMKNDKDAQKRWDETYKPKAEKEMMAMMGGLGSCMQDPAVMSAMKRLQ